MEHVAEHILELHVLDVPGLPAEVRRNITVHLADCDACSRVAESIREFYAQLRQEPPPAADAIEKVMWKAFPSASVIVLHSHRFTPRMNGPDPLHTSVLAAAGREQELVDETVSTLVNHEQRLILRVRREGGNRFRLFLHAENMSDVEGALVSLPGLDSRCVLDNRGQCEFSLAHTPQPEDWGTLQAIVRTPICVKSISAREMREGCTFGFHDTSATVSGSDGMIAVTMEHASPVNPSMCVIASADAQPMVAVFEGGVARLTIESLPPRVTLRVYE